MHVSHVLRYGSTSCLGLMGQDSSIGLMLILVWPPLHVSRLVCAVVSSSCHVLCALTFVLVITLVITYYRWYVLLEPLFQSLTQPSYNLATLWSVKLVVTGLPLLRA